MRGDKVWNVGSEIDRCTYSGRARLGEMCNICLLDLPDGMASMVARDACSTFGVLVSSLTKTMWFPDTETTTPPIRQKERRANVLLDTIGSF